MNSGSSFLVWPSLRRSLAYFQKDVWHWSQIKVSKQSRNRGVEAEQKKVKVISLEKKLDNVRELQKGKSRRAVAFIFEIPKSTIANMFLPAKIRHLQKIRCIIREPQYDKLDRACYMWFMQHRSKGAPMSGLVL